jgi:hypothetical protein
MNDSKPLNSEAHNATLLGFYAAILTSVVTLITFGIAFFTPPLSGPFCGVSCITYPFTDILSRFPRDYLWMYPAMFLSLVFLVLLACIHYFGSIETKVFSHLGLLFGLISSCILLLDYFVQVSVIQPSLVNGETEGITILSQYNPHGVFIVLEDIGYFMMSLALLCVSPVFSSKNRLEIATRWLFIIGFVLTIGSFVVVSIQYGIHREYRFEVIVISINWLVLIISGILLSLVFKRALKRSQK